MKSTASEPSLTYSIKRAREIRKFHIAVVQLRLRNVQKSVMHVQSCCFANLPLLLFCRSRCRRSRRCLSSMLLWSRNFATLVTWRHSTSLYCWFARDVTAAMLDDQNKSISLLWELKLYFHVNSSRKTSYPTWPPCHVVANQELTFCFLLIDSDKQSRSDGGQRWWL